MKQIIKKYSNGRISYKYYENDRGERHGSYIAYYHNGNVGYIGNCVNGKEYSLESWWGKDGKIYEQKYHL